MNFHTVCKPGRGVTHCIRRLQNSTSSKVRICSFSRPIRATRAHRYMCAASTNESLQIAPHCILEVACFTFIRCVASVNSIVHLQSTFSANWALHVHICTVSLQCEHECTSSADIYLQNGHRMFHICTVSIYTVV